MERLVDDYILECDPRLCEQLAFVTESRRFHVWRMDWNETAIRLYLDDELLNEVPLSTAVNGRIGNYTNPFHRSQYILLNLALGGDNGSTIDDAAFPMRYEIDYVRVYSR